MSTVGELIGEERFDDTSEVLSAWQTASNVLATVEIHWRDGQMYAEGLVSCGFDEHFTELVEIPFDELDEYANKRARKIEMWFSTRYGCVVENEDWTNLMARFTIMIREDTLVDEVEGLIESRTDAVRLFNESDPGTYGCDDLWRRLADHLSRS